MHLLTRRQILSPLVIAALLILAACWTARDATAGTKTASDGQWIYLSDLQWDEASTGWLGVANQQVPALDRAFQGGQLAIAGATYNKGIGTYPLSEITYSLNGQYARFASEIGLDAGAHSDASVRFLVFVDGILSYQGDYMRAGDPAEHIDISVAGAQSLRLVADAPFAQAKGGFADWAGACLLIAGVPDATPTVRPAARATSTTAERQKNEDALRARGSAMATALPASLRAVKSSSERPTGQFDRRSSKAWLSTGRVAVGVGIDSTTFGTITLLDLTTPRLVISNAGGSVSLDQEYAFSADMLRRGAAPLEFAAVEDPIAGPGRQVVLHAQTSNRRWQVNLIITLFANDTIAYEIAVLNAGSEQAVTFQHFSYNANTATLLAEGDVEYLTDYSRLHYGRLFDDGIVRREPVGQGKPIFIYSARRQGGLLMALLDDTAGPTYVQMQVKPGEAQTHFGLLSRPASVAMEGQVVRSGRLYVEITRTADVRYAFTKLRYKLNSIAPEAALPEWFKFQWLSWYVYGMNNDAEAVQRQSDYIAANLADLGPWNLLIDAGWYVSEGRDNSDWRTIDTARFPDGIRTLVDRLHDQGNRVVLYLSVPYIDSIQADGHWLGMRTLIEQHPDWLIQLGGDDSHQSYAFDFTNPAVLQFWSEVMDDFFYSYDVDGIKIDGMGNAEGAILSPDKLDEFGLIGVMNEQAMATYTFFYLEAVQRKRDAYLETGWLTPTFSRTFVHTFRYGDEAPYFSNPYPFPGLVEHINYAIVQKEILGLRPNMGAIYDNPNQSTINRWWLEAALALGTHVTLGFDLAGMTPDTLSAYRSLLTQYEPFSGETTYGRGLRPQTFATARDGTTYLGVLNRNRVQRTMAAPLADHGLDLSRPATAYDVEEDRFLRLSSPFTVTLPAESFRLYIVRQDAGVLWTNSSFIVQEDAQGMTVVLTGPDDLPGFVHVLAPPPQRVLLDDNPATDATYDNETGVLSVRYTNAVSGHVLTIDF